MSHTDSSSYKLYYFPLRGRAEAIRLICAYAGVQYEAISVSSDEWKRHDPIRKEMPLDEMPVLVVNGTIKIPQSWAIYRFLGKRFGLDGRTDIENALLDAYGDACKDLAEFTREWRWMVGKYIDGDPNDKYEMETKASIAKYANYFQSILGQNQWLLGNDRVMVTLYDFNRIQVTWADLAIAEAMDQLRVMRSDVLDAYPIIGQWINRMHQLPEIKEYLPTRHPKTYFWQ